TAKLETARADVRGELSAAWESLQAASRGLDAVSSMSATIDRDITFVGQAVRAGAFDAVQRTQALRRLLESGRLADTTVRDFRSARAAWIRQSARWGARSARSTIRGPGQGRRGRSRAQAGARSR